MLTGMVFQTTTPVQMMNTCTKGQGHLVTLAKGFI